MKTKNIALLVAFLEACIIKLAQNPAVWDGIGRAIWRSRIVPRSDRFLAEQIYFVLEKKGGIMSEVLPIYRKVGFTPREVRLEILDALTRLRRNGKLLRVIGRTSEEELVSYQYTLPVSYCCSQCLLNQA